MHGGTPDSGPHASGGPGLGMIVFVFLAILTIVEYIIATQMESKMLLLIGIAFLKAVAILWYFMHVARAWRAHQENR